MFPPATVHLIEPNPDGHRAWFVRWLLSDPPGDRQWVLHTTRAAARHPALRALLAQRPAGLRVSWITVPPAGDPANPLALLRHHLRRARAYRRALRPVRHRADQVVFIPYVDDVLFGLAPLRRPFGANTLIALGMRGDWEPPPAGLARRARLVRALRRRALLRLIAAPGCGRYLSNQPPLVRLIARARPALAPKLVAYGDPAPSPPAVDRVQARGKAGCAPGQRLLLYFGPLARRKGLAELIALVAHRDWHPDHKVLLAGPMTPDAEALLAGTAAAQARAAGVLELHAGVVPEQEAAALMAAADAVWVAYRGHHGMSGVLVQAGAHARAVVACPEGLIGWYARRHRLGWIHDPAEPIDARVRALNAFLADDARRRACGQRARDCFAGHTVPAFVARVRAQLWPEVA